MTDYRSTKAKLNEMRTRLEKHGLTITTDSPGDGVMRYRFHVLPNRQYSDPRLHTAFGWKEAETYARGLLDGYARGLSDGIEHATKPQDPPK